MKAWDWGHRQESKTTDGSSKLVEPPKMLHWSWTCTRVGGKRKAQSNTSNTREPVTVTYNVCAAAAQTAVNAGLG
jgi:hypothetical protein